MTRIDADIMSKARAARARGKKPLALQYNDRKQANIKERTLDHLKTCSLCNRFFNLPI